VNYSRMGVDINYTFLNGETNEDDIAFLDTMPDAEIQGFSYTYYNNNSFPNIPKSPDFDCIWFANCGMLFSLFSTDLIKIYSRIFKSSMV